MRIAYAGTLPPHPGGSAILGMDLLVGLARRGHEVTAIAPITAAARGLGEPLRDAPFVLTRYLVSAFESAPNQPASEEFRALEGRNVVAHLTPLLETAKPDLVIAGRETFAWSVPALARRHGVPCVVLAQGGTTWGLLGGAYPPDLARELLQRIGEATCVIAVARHLGRRLREVGLERVEVVPNAVDTQAFAPAPRDPTLARELGIGGDSVVVAHVSNLKALKRPLDVVHSAAVALRREPGLVYVVVGDGPCRAAMEAECKRAAILDRFRFTGWVPRADVVHYLNLADIVAMPSEAEALALVYLETQACGRVLIASDIAAAREVVEDGETGLLFRVGDVAAMTAVTLRAAADPGLRARIGVRARAFAEAHTFAAALTEYETILSAATK